MKGGNTNDLKNLTWGSKKGLQILVLSLEMEYYIKCSRYWKRSDSKDPAGKQLSLFKHVLQVYCEFSWCSHPISAVTLVSSVGVRHKF